MQSTRSDILLICERENNHDIHMPASGETPTVHYWKNPRAWFQSDIWFEQTVVQWNLMKLN
jgi:hypothetical protein